MTCSNTASLRVIIQLFQNTEGHNYICIEMHMWNRLINVLPCRTLLGSNVLYTVLYTIYTICIDCVVEAGCSTTQTFYAVSSLLWNRKCIFCLVFLCFFEVWRSSATHGSCGVNGAFSFDAPTLGMGTNSHYHGNSKMKVEKLLQVLLLGVHVSVLAFYVLHISVFMNAYVSFNSVYSKGLICL